ncbi:hypothetical protein [Mycobacterium sp. 94-17]|uniref:hypothetical protein n=1 Tax=Mycobacterium sp. 94-17 TaxID=2986147 RepID=UPI002D1F8B20|nr:hypothetical protein [Mycobacterium sp. 94-17]MEB4209154.1 hypothetical protein [Mycobacterium sp. 94-17]
MTTPVRADLAIDGGREHPAFVGPAGGAVFACLHRPSTPPRRLVLLCSSIAAEWKFNYRREVLLARRLAKLGIAAARLHYRGTGHSDDGEVTFGGMVDDVARVREWACRQVDVEHTVYFGSRLGAMVAAAAGRSARAPLACWNAPPAGDAYFREIFRNLSVGRLAAPRTVDDMRAPDELLRSGEPLDVLGYTLGPALYRSACTLLFSDELGPLSRAVNLVEIGDALHAERAARHAARLREQGFDVVTDVVEEARSWWLDGSEFPRPDEAREAVGGLVERTAGWLAAVAGREAPRGA